MNTYISASAWPSHLLCPSLNHKKSVTFHTNKARPHHLLCIVRTFLLELCFWILTVTVPDPGLNGNLASGPFGFLIEYPCSRLFNVPQRANMTWPRCPHHGGIKHVSPNPLEFCREVPLISQSKKKKWATQ